MISRKLAETRLRKRYIEQATIYPIMFAEMPCDVYVRANVRRVMENDLLASYDREANWRPPVSGGR